MKRHFESLIKSYDCCKLRHICEEGLVKLLRNATVTKNHKFIQPYLKSLKNCAPTLAKVINE